MNLWIKMMFAAMFFALSMGTPVLAGAGSDKAVAGSSDELEEGSNASVDDGMGRSRFGDDGDDTYTDDSASLDDLTKSKFQDEKSDDDREVNEDDR
jgi:hypothetical protein